MLAESIEAAFITIPLRFGQQLVDRGIHVGELGRVFVTLGKPGLDLDADVDEPGRQTFAVIDLAAVTNRSVF
jgi:hypothetical protein